MMIKKLTIENFRSIEKLEVELSNLNALIGPNSSGKTNILRALDLVVGATYPSIRSFDESDFYLHDTSRKIIIKVIFEEPITYQNYKVYGFNLSYINGKDNIMDYVAIDNHGAPLKYSGKEIKVNNEMREKVNMMYLPLDRQAYQQISPSLWKIYGKLLKHIANKLDAGSKLQFKSDIENSFYNNIFKDTIVEDTENLLKKYVKEQTGLNLNLKLSILDPADVLKNLRPFIIDKDNFEVNVENEGAGVQSAVAIAIARVYAEIVQQPLILAIEEPELFLHPHACRHFYKILKELSQKGVQVIYTTHERSFVNVADLDSILLIKKENGGTKVYKCNSNIENIDRIKMASKFDEEINEVFFANKVILVEGPDDKIACKLALEKLGVELDKHNISVIDCGGNTGIIPMVRILKSFNIDTYVLMDQDPGNSKTEKIIEELQHLVDRDLIDRKKIFFQCPNLEGILKLKSKLTKETALESLPKWFEQNEVPSVYKELKNMLIGPEENKNG